ncbi:MAG TPA: cyclic nucleotide-binding domain-containing protein [Xanthobacteraceae bacterium]|nr:cyclic nucleotide-binding domain-containing protein [Xanthobacteraceae bacterium]
MTVDQRNSLTGRPRPLPVALVRDGESAGAAAIAEDGRRACYPPRSLIFLEGDRAETVFQVESGAVMLYMLLPDGRRQIVEILGPGDAFGFSSSALHDASAETLTATRCIAFERSAVERSPALMTRLSARLHAQLCALHDHIMLLGRKSSMERIASFLIRCVPGRGGPACPGRPAGAADRADIRLAMTRYGIADYLGLTIETVSRSFARLKRRGIVSISKIDEISIRDVCELCRLTGTHLSCELGGVRPRAWPARRADAARGATR